MPAASEPDTAVPAVGPPPPAEQPAVPVGDAQLSAQVRGLVTRWRALGGTAEAFEAVGWDWAGNPGRWVRCRSIAVRASITPRPERGLVGWSHVSRAREGYRAPATELWLRFAGWPARRGTLAEVRAYCDRRPAERAPATLEGL